MGALGRVMAGDVSIPFTPSTYDQALTSSKWMAGIDVTPDVAMTIDAVYACTTVISESIATAPLHMYETLGEDGKRPAPDHPLEEKLHDEPNDYQTAIEFREMMTAFALLRGKGVAEVLPGPSGPVDQVRPLHPDLIVEEVTQSGRRRFRYNDPILHRERILLPDEVFVVRGRFGRSVLSYARENFALQISMRRYASGLYEHGARFQGVVQHPKTLSDKARQAIRRALDEYRSGGEREGRPLLLEEGMEWQSISLTNRDAEFLATRKFDVATTARWFRVPLHKIQDLDRSTNNNIEHQAIEWVTDGLVPWAERWEQAIRRDLIIDQVRYFAEHNMDGLLRGDIETRYKAYALGRQWGWLSVNDIRRLENKNPIEGGDVYLEPLNMTSAEGERLAYTAPISVQAKGYLRAMVRDQAARAVRKEEASLAKLAQQTGGSGDAYRDGVVAFYREHADFVAKVLRISDEAAAAYASTRCRQTLDGGDPDDEPVTQLTNLAIERADVLRLPAAA